MHKRGERTNQYKTQFRHGHKSRSGLSRGSNICAQSTCCGAGASCIGFSWHQQGSQLCQVVGGVQMGVDAQVLVAAAHGRTTSCVIDIRCFVTVSAHPS